MLLHLNVTHVCFYDFYKIKRLRPAVYLVTIKFLSITFHLALKHY